MAEVPVTGPQPLLRKIESKIQVVWFEGSVLNPAFLTRIGITIASLG